LTGAAAPPWPSILLIGPTGSGKTPLGEEIERRGLQGRSCVHFDFGADLRALAAGESGRAFLPDEELARIRGSLATGALFEARDLPMIAKILRDFAARRSLGPGALLVLNGMPRHVRQAEGLAGTVSVELVVFLKADAAVIRERLRLDPGGDRSGRVDDTIGAIRRRLSDYEKRTRPLVEFYALRGVPVVTIPVTAAMTAAEMYDVLAAGLRAGKGERR
jgi:adenylate kinase